MDIKTIICKDISRVDEIMALYKKVVNEVNKTKVKLGWNTETYPDEEFVRNAINRRELFIVTKNIVNGEKIVAVAVVNHTVNREYDDIDWQIKLPEDKISTIHALATDPDYRGGSISDFFLKSIEEYCKNNGNTAIHLDVIDTNIPAYRLYERNGYKEVECVSMYYEVVGTRQFWMMEKVL